MHGHLRTKENFLASRESDPRLRGHPPILPKSRELKKHTSGFQYICHKKP